MSIFTKYKDHLGNVRLSYTDANRNGSITQNEVVEETNYYAFGMKHQGYNFVTQPYGNSNAQKYKYNGIEYEEALGIDMYEMLARQYDPTIARWVVIDPVVHHSLSPYNAFDNNPVFWADPSGSDSIRIQDFNGDWHTVDGEDYIDVYNSNTGGFGDFMSSFGRVLEDPISFIGNLSGGLYKVFQKMKANSIDGDLIFQVLAHGSKVHIQGLNKDLYTAEQFDKQMKELSPAYKKAIEKKSSFSLFLLACWSATDSAGENLSFAAQISKQHPEATIYGFDGRGHWSPDGLFLGICNSPPDANGEAHNLNQGYLVVFKNGKEVERSSSTYPVKLFINQSLGLL